MEKDFTNLNVSKSSIPNFHILADIREHKFREAVTSFGTIAVKVFYDDNLEYLLNSSNDGIPQNPRLLSSPLPSPSIHRKILNMAHTIHGSKIMNNVKSSKLGILEMNEQQMDKNYPDYENNNINNGNSRPQLQIFDKDEFDSEKSEYSNKKDNNNNLLFHLESTNYQDNDDNFSNNGICEENGSCDKLSSINYSNFPVEEYRTYGGDINLENSLSVEVDKVKFEKTTHNDAKLNCNIQIIRPSVTNPLVNDNSLSKRSEHFKPLCFNSEHLPPLPPRPIPLSLLLKPCTEQTTDTPNFSSLRIDTIKPQPMLSSHRRNSISSSSAPSEYFGSFVGSYETSILNGRMSTLPSKPVVFLAEIGVVGFGKCRPNLKCPPHLLRNFNAYFYDLKDEHPTPYVGTIDFDEQTGCSPSSFFRSPSNSTTTFPDIKLDSSEGSGPVCYIPIGAAVMKGYRIPFKGQLQIVYIY